MRRRFRSLIAVVLLASCSEPSTPPEVRQPAAQAPPPTATGSTPTPLAGASTASAGTSVAAVPGAHPAGSAVAPPPPSGPPVTQVVVYYDSTSPDNVIVNGNALELAELDQKLPGEFRRLEALQTGKPPFPYSTLRIEVDAATPYSMVRRLHDVLESAGARQAQLVVEGFTPAAGVRPEDVPLHLELPASYSDAHFAGPFTDAVEIRVTSTREGRTETMKVGLGPTLEGDPVSNIVQTVGVQFIRSADAGQDPPRYAVLADNRLRADELAEILFACQYRPAIQSGHFMTQLKHVSIAPIPEPQPKEITQKLERKIEPSTNLGPANSPSSLNTIIGQPTPTRRGRLFGTPLK